MARHIVKFPDLVIEDGGTQSNVVSSPQGFGHTVDLILYAANVAVTILVGYDKDMDVGDLIALQVEPGTDFTVAASKAGVIPTSSFLSLAVEAAGAVTGDKTYRLRGQVEAAGI